MLRSPRLIRGDVIPCPGWTFELVVGESFIEPNDLRISGHEGKQPSFGCANIDLREIYLDLTHSRWITYLCTMAGHITYMRDIYSELSGPCLCRIEWL